MGWLVIERIGEGKREGGGWGWIGPCNIVVACGSVQAKESNRLSLLLTGTATD